MQYPVRHDDEPRHTRSERRDRRVEEGGAEGPRERSRISAAFKQRHQPVHRAGNGIR